MILRVLDYCDVVWHECGEGNGDKIQWLQRRGVRVVSFEAASKLLTESNYDQTGLGISLL